nr:MAG TPA: hypothetical protein [Caudoviricetes sp.]
MKFFLIPFKIKLSDLFLIILLCDNSSIYCNKMQYAKSFEPLFYLSLAFFYYRYYN